MASKRHNGGGSLYRRTPAGAWHVAWYDHSGARRERSTKTTDKAAAGRILAKFVADAALRRAGVIDPRSEDFANADRRSITDHLADFKKDLTARGNTPAYCADTHTLAASILADAKVTRISEISPAAVRQAVGARKNGGMSLARCNHALRAVKSFSKWLYRNRRAHEDALMTLSLFNTATDRRVIRRVLTEDEVIRLVEAAERGREVLCVSGVDRGMLYRVALGTGFRASELDSLTPESFDLASKPPTITVKAACSKRRREDTQPIRADLAERLRPWLAKRPAGEPVFRVHGKGARMMREDLRAAGILYRDDAERVADFHSLRHGYISRIVASGASVKEAQELARHSTPMLTIGRYSHARLHDLTRALEALPETERPASEASAMKATGTDNNRPHDAKAGAPLTLRPVNDDGKAPEMTNSAHASNASANTGAHARRGALDGAERVADTQHGKAAFPAGKSEGSHYGATPRNGKSVKGDTRANWILHPSPHDGVQLAHTGF